MKLSDKVDTGNGIYQVQGRERKDHNWHRGGYAELTVQEGLAASSNIAIYKTIEKAFGANPQTFFDLLTNMSYGKPDSINGIASLQPYKITEKNITWNCIGSVSYTHLDVYKRQVIRLSTTKDALLLLKFLLSMRQYTVTG